MVTILQGDALEVQGQLPSESVNCIVTSPPYWGLRDYGVEGQLGLEATPEGYVEKMVEVFRRLRRVLRTDGTLWLNLGDSYCAAPSGKVGDKSTFEGSRRNQEASRAGQRIGHRSSFRRDRAPRMDTPHKAAPALKPKDLVGIPWRVAFALQADGWWLRSDIIWAKPNPMPESVTDRPTKAHEYVFLLSKSARYYFDADAVREPFQYGPDDRNGGTSERQWRQRAPESKPRKSGNAARRYPNGNGGRPADHLASGVPWEDDGRGRNVRSVWSIATEPFAEAHFATFPTELAKRCILAGCPKGGTVLDPFAGSGTAGLVADRLGRDFVGFELKPEYVEMAKRRIRGDAPLFADVNRA